MQIFQISSEVVPFSKTGGLADVLGALPKSLKKLGYTTSVITPLYPQQPGTKKILNDLKVYNTIEIPFFKGNIPTRILYLDKPEGVRVYFVENNDYFDRAGIYGEPYDYPDNLERFAFFSRAAVELIKHLSVDDEVIVHAHDWETALVIVYLKTIYKDQPFTSRIRTVYTIHNMAYQGQFDYNQWHITSLPDYLFTINGLEFYGRINLMKGGIIFADKITTVSRTYAKEIQTPEYGYGLDGVLRTRANDLVGIVNGIDYEVWNPATDPHLYGINYDINSLENKKKIKQKLLEEYGLSYNESTPVIGIISRLVAQKGFDLIEQVQEELADLDMEIVLLGTGEPRYEEMFRKLAAKYPDKISVKIEFNNTLAHRIEAGADMFLMPSRYEPCGLNQLYSLRYGTIPIVRNTGGLADTIEDGVTGFKFYEYDAWKMLEAIKKAIDVFKNQPEKWSDMQKEAMSRDFSWDNSAREYIRLYKSIF